MSDQGFRFRISTDWSFRSTRPRGSFDVTTSLAAEDGHHAGVWNDSNCVAAGTVRKVSSLVRVNQGPVPLWSSDLRGADAYSSRDNC